MFARIEYLIPFAHGEKKKKIETSELIVEVVGIRVLKCILVLAVKTFQLRYRLYVSQQLKKNSQKGGGKHRKYTDIEVLKKFICKKRATGVERSDAKRKRKKKKQVLVVSFWVYK